MAGPWEKYAVQPTDVQKPGKPWERYAAPAASSNPNRPAGLPEGVDLPSLPEHPAVNMQAPRSPYLDTASPANVAAANVLKGVVKSIPGTLSGIAKLAPGVSDVTDPLDAAAQTHGTAQAIGKGVGNAAQFLIPGGAEEAGAAKLAPMIGKAGSKIAASALSSGIVNKAQGGSFVAGAAMGGIGSGAVQGFKSWAPAVAESALKVLGNDRMYGRTVGQAILDDTNGFKPAKVMESAQNKINELRPELENIAQESANSGARGSLAPARTAVQDTIAGHINNRAVNTANDIKPIQNFLAKDSVTGLPLSESQSPVGLLRMKQGVDADLIGNWNPNKNSKQALGAARNAYGNIADEFHATAPGTKEIDQRISSLIPVADRAERVSLMAPTTQQLFNKLAAPTGALVAPVAGGTYGYQHGGAGGAVAGAVGGMALPAFLATPTGQMALARGLYSGTLSNTIAPLVTGGALTMGRSLFGDSNQKGK